MFDPGELRRTASDLFGDARSLAAAGHHVSAAAAYAEARKAFVLLGDREAMARSAFGLGRSLAAAGQGGEAVGHLTDAGQGARSAGAMAAAGTAFDLAGEVLSGLGRQREALDAHASAEECYLAADERRLAWGARVRGGQAAHELGDHQGCVDRLGGALTASPPNDVDEGTRARLSGYLGSSLVHLRRPGQAEAWLRTALRLGTARGDHRHAAVSASLLARCLDDLGKTAEATATLELAATHFLAAEELPLAADRLEDAAWRRRDADDRQAEADDFDALHGVLERLGDAQGAAEAADHAGAALATIGRGEEALEWHHKAMAVFKAIGTDADVAICHELSGDACTTLGRHSDALQHYQAGRALSVQLEDAMDVARFDDRIGLALHHQDRFTDSADAHRRAVDALLVLEERELAATAAVNLGWSLGALGRHQDARALLREVLPVLDAAGLDHAAAECREQLDNPGAPHVHG